MAVGERAIAVGRRRPRRRASACAGVARWSQSGLLPAGAHRAQRGGEARRRSCRRRSARSRFSRVRPRRRCEANSGCAIQRVDEGREALALDPCGERVVGSDPLRALRLRRRSRRSALEHEPVDPCRGGRGRRAARPGRRASSRARRASRSPSRSRRRTSSSATCGRPPERTGAGEDPCPGRSMATTRWRAASRERAGSQVATLPVNPCSRTSAGPSPCTSACSVMSMPRARLRPESRRGGARPGCGRGRSGTASTAVRSARRRLAHRGRQQPATP